MEPWQLERFWSRVEKTSTCWNWTGTLNHGYGTINLKIGGIRKNWMAHRLAYEQIIAPIPPGLHIDHLCRNTGCVNPAHLDPVTTQENCRRGYSPLAIKARQTHCVHGHEFTEENTYRWRYQRKCRACMKRRDQEARARKRDAA